MKPKWLPLYLLPLFLITLPSWSVSQGIEVFRVNDFLAPYEHRREKVDQNDPTSIAPFFSSRFFSGADQGYTYRNDFFGQDLLFARVVNNFYFSRFQINANATKYWPSASDESPLGAQGIPKYRFGIEGSIYDSLDAEEPGRFKLIWNASRLFSGKTIHEFGFGIDVKVKDEDRFVGGLDYSWKPSADEHNVILAYDYSLRSPSQSGFDATLGFALNGVHNGRFGGALRFPEMKLQIPISPNNVFLHVGYSAAFSFRKHQVPDQTRRFNQEVVAFLSFPVFNRLSQ